MLNLSTSTISRALNDHPDISIETKNKVREAAKLFKYSTNLHAKHFRNQNSELIALIVPEINMFYYPKLIQGITEKIENAGYSLFIFLSNESFEREKEIIQHCQKWAVEGVLISLSKETSTLDHLKVLDESEIQYVLLDKILENDKAQSVVIDNHDASYKAVKFLVENGHQSILGIFGDPNLSITSERIKGFSKAISDFGERIIHSTKIAMNSCENLESELTKHLFSDARYTAIFTMTDDHLSHTLFTLNKQGIQVPDDISIISISDGIYPYLMYPQVCFIKDSGLRMGQMAAQTLLNKLDGRSIDDAHRITLSTELIVLDSVKMIK